MSADLPLKKFSDEMTQDKANLIRIVIITRVDSMLVGMGLYQVYIFYWYILLVYTIYILIYYIYSNNSIIKLKNLNKIMLY